MFFAMRLIATKMNTKVVLPVEHLLRIIRKSLLFYLRNSYNRSIKQYDHTDLLWIPKFSVHHCKHRKSACPFFLQQTVVQNVRGFLDLFFFDTCKDKFIWQAQLTLVQTPADS